MVKMYNEPEFKLVNVALEDVLTTSLETVGETWDSGAGSGNVSPFFGTPFAQPHAVRKGQACLYPCGMADDRLCRPLQGSRSRLSMVHGGGDRRELFPADGISAVFGRHGKDKGESR